MQNSSQTQTSRITVTQNQRYVHERVSEILGLLSNKVAKPSEILGIAKKSEKEKGKNRKELNQS